MAAKTTVTGLIAEPVLRYTQNNKAVLNVGVNGTASRKNDRTGKWEDIGEPVWFEAPFWEDEAERLAEVLHKGDKISVEGTLVVETFQRRDGGSGFKLKLHFPTFLGVVPRAARGGGGQWGGQQGNQGDWRSQPTAGYGQSDQAGFDPGPGYGQQAPGGFDQGGAPF